MLFFFLADCSILQFLTLLPIILSKCPYHPSHYSWKWQILLLGPSACCFFRSRTLDRRSWQPTSAYSATHSYWSCRCIAAMHLINARYMWLGRAWYSQKTLKMLMPGSSYNTQARGSVGHPIWVNGMVHLPHKWNFGRPTTLPLPATPPSPLTATPEAFFLHTWRHTFNITSLLRILSVLPCFRPVLHARNARV